MFKPNNKEFKSKHTGRIVRCEPVGGVKYLTKCLTL